MAEIKPRSSASARLGENTFSFDRMKDQIPREFYDKLMFAIRNHRPITQETADVIAHSMKEWALLAGATHYTHWFQPLSGLAAEKHNTFLSLDEDGRPIDRFSGRDLIMSEPDASSFPHGGLRSTFEARGYAAWDPTSPAFLIKRERSTTLCLPSVFVSFKGEVLDKKTPLLRSIAAVSKASVRMLRALGNKRVTSVVPYVGAEQEYFLVSADLAAMRPDLSEVGATLIGAPPAKGQQLEDHYFRAINEKVLDFMEDVEEELIRLGVPVKTRHNEVAPAQFELAVLHQPVNISSDQNQLIMEVLRRIAPRYGLDALLHEKPFAQVNGSGKHNNWSLVDSEGNNLLEPSSHPSAQLRFLFFLMAVVRGVARYGPLLYGIVASAGNDLRLGGNEAPPRIMSVHLGGYLESILTGLSQATLKKNGDHEEIDLGLGGVARIPRDTTDRNRTSPFAFTGNKFEFRAVGSSVSISLPNAVINAMVAESLDAMAERLEKRMAKGEGRSAAAVKVLQDVIEETEPCRFEGDCYSTDWSNEAVRRGLDAPPTAPEAMAALKADQSVALFERYGILTKEETEARYRIKLDLYIKTVAVELRVAMQMLSTQVLPAAVRYQRELAGALTEIQAALGAKAAGLEEMRSVLARVTELVGQLLKRISVLESDDRSLGVEHADLQKRAEQCASKVRPDIEEARRIADQLELLVDGKLWPFPRYGELLSIKI